MIGKTGNIILKKAGLCFSLLMMLLNFSACKAVTAVSDVQTPAASTSAAASNQSHILVAYFSCTGNTQKAAQTIAGATRADLYQIIPAEPYTSADLDYNNKSSRTTSEMNDVSVRPAIQGTVENFDKYDIVFLGYPIWWGDAPRIIDTFLESYDFTGKTIIPFCTSGQSDISTSESNLKGLSHLQGVQVTWLDGKRLSADVSETDVIAWINSMNLKVQ